MFSGQTVEFVSSAWATPGSMHEQTTYDIDLIFDNLFPCIDFTADFVLHYEGSIPASKHC